MYLEQLRIENVKVLADQVIDFCDAEGNPRRWTVILGENGSCKSTILQLIALLASGPLLSRSILNDPSSLINDNGSESAKFEATFATSKTEKIRAGLEARHGHRVMKGYNESEEIDHWRSEERPGFFTLGYGVGRYLPEPGEVAVPNDLTVDRIEGLFRPQHKLLGIDFYEALRQFDPTNSKGSLARAYSKRIRQALLATDETGEQLLPALNTVELRGHQGVSRMTKLLESRRFEVNQGGQTYRLPPSSLSQGYQSTIAWICDLLGHAFLEHKTDIDPADLEGLVLLDEIDLHLHPQWQRRLIPALARAFPRLQFIVTTHSPLVVTGVDAESVVRLEMSDGAVRQSNPVVEPGLADASALLGALFAVPRAGRPILIEKERDYLRLRATDPENRRVKELERQLMPYWQGERELEDFDTDGSLIE